MKTSLRRHLLTDELYTLLKEQIMSQTYAPGDRVNIDQVARELDVSNIPIREALTRLAAEGFIQVVPYKGMFVANMSVSELDEMFEVRLELESLAIRKAITRIPEVELQNLHERMQNWYTTPRTNDEKLEYVVKMNEGLHGTILKHCGNQTLKQLVVSFIERMTRQEIDDQLHELEWKEHLEVVNALRQRDVERAVEAMREHLRQSHQRTRTFVMKKDLDLANTTDRE